MTDQLPLAAEFSATSQAEWRKLVEAALKGASFEKRLVSQTYDGLRVEPLYPRALGLKPVAGRTPGAAWTLMQRVDHPDPAAANAQALHDLENGATGLSFEFAGGPGARGFGIADATKETLARVLDGVVLDAGVDISLNPVLGHDNAGINLADVVAARGVDPAKVDVRFNYQPLTTMAVRGAAAAPWTEMASPLAKIVHDLMGRGFKGPFVLADGRLIHDAGGSEAQELAFALAVAASYLRALEAGGIALDEARSALSFRLAADADEFLTIAKFRALRKLWARVEDVCGLTPKPTYVAAETAWRMMTRRDPYVNMLRMTIAVTAAGLGGADSIVALPHTAPLGLPDAFARRIARNTQLILLEESNLAKVADPAAGSGAIEDLTAKLCAAAWSQFQEIEAAGGAWAALERGLIQKNVAAVRAERQKAIARRRDALTGTSDFPNLHEKPAAVLDVAPVTTPKEGAAAVTIEPLSAIRLAEPFEALREASDRWLAKTGVRPKVFLANLGKLPNFTARAMFAKSFYEAGGIEAVSNDGFKDQTAMVAAFKASGAKLACLCSSDAVYAEQATQAAKALTALGATVQLAGRPGENEANWRQAGVKSFIFMGCDVVSTLQAAHDILGVK
jgi:methylmalonyl-CoA mutase